jgi:TonB family protein
MPMNLWRTRGGTLLAVVFLMLLAGCAATGETVGSSSATDERCREIDPAPDAPAFTSVMDMSAMPAAILHSAATDTLLLQARYDSTGALAYFHAHGRPGRRVRAEAATLALRPYVATTWAAPATSVSGLLIPGSSPRIAAVQLSYECPPRLLNTGHITRRLQQLARDSTMRGGHATLWMKVDEEGRTTETRLIRSSGQSAQDNSMMRVARQARFTPALLEGYAVPVWIQMPFSITRR